MAPDAQAPIAETTTIPTRPIEFDTARLRLRQWRLSDFAPFAAMNADPRVMEFFPELLRAPESHAMARRIRSLLATRGWGLWAVEEHAGAPFVGFVGLHEPALELPCSPCVEIGWRLAPAFWGRGYATEAARGALAVAFDLLDLDEVVSFTSRPNLRSQAVMQRLGMRADAATFEHPDVPAGSPLREHVLYRMRRADWEARK
jgi:RimJ/RimL family protein N-acetyltransferase